MVGEHKLKKISVIYSTFPSKKSAEKCAKALLNEKLVGCAVFFNSKSFYFWNKKLAKEKETLCFFKTTEKKAKSAIKLLEKTHPYKTPCILTFEAKSNDKYFQWLNTIEEAQIA